MKTFIPKAADIDRKWYVVDADGMVLGRLASQVANILRGKNKPEYTPHADMGDYVIVVNAEDSENGFDWANDKHTAFTITMRDEFNDKWKSIERVAFSVE